MYFQDDPNLSFPGFREDMSSDPNNTQAVRDASLWPGACPPKEPRIRPQDYKLNKDQTYAQVRVSTVTSPFGPQHCILDCVQDIVC